MKFIKINSFDLGLILDDIYSKGISSILVEGGTKTINYFIEKNLWNEVENLFAKELQTSLLILKLYI